MASAMDPSAPSLLLEGAGSGLLVQALKATCPGIACGLPLRELFPAADEAAGGAVGAAVVDKALRLWSARLADSASSASDPVRTVTPMRLSAMGWPPKLVRRKCE